MFKRKKQSPAPKIRAGNRFEIAFDGFALYTITL
jgi:hypothetical protein